MIRAIAAIDDARAIAKNGSIPWNIPEDTAYYKQKTNGHTVVMGRATYELFANPLPNRRNIVISDSLDNVRVGFEHMSLQQAIALPGDIWIVGGAGLYASALQYCEELYITHVQGDFGGDRFFPEFEQEFSLREQSKIHRQNDHLFTYCIYVR